MARIIPEGFWRKSFLMPDGRYDGKKFEGLALQLLERIYGVGWQPTASSHDGSRDFEKQDTRGRLWAECKAYSEKLSIYIVSPTLVMALINDPHTVIIVSRSGLNNNALRHLAAYQAASGKTILSYDGSVLDDAILANDLYKAFFPTFPQPHTAAPQLQVQWSVTNDALLEPSALDFKPHYQRTRSSRSIDTVRYGLIRVDLSFKNFSSTSGTVITLDLLKETLDSSLRIICFNGDKQATSCSLRIRPAGIVRVSLIAQPCEAREQLPLPRVRITGKGAPKQPIDTGTLHVSHLYQIEVVGVTHRRTLEQAERFLHNRRRTVIISIEGAGGTGKSRLLHEIARLGLEEGFRCHFYNPEFEDARGAEHVVRRLLADLSELPLIRTEDQPTGTPSAFSSAPLLARALYDPTFVVWDHIEGILTTIISLLDKKKTLLIIDNVQFTSDRFAALIESLLAELSHLHDKRIAIVLSFNTDFERPESQVGMLLTKLRAWSVDNSSGSVIFHSRLSDFDTKDVAEFVERVFSGKPTDGEAAFLYEKTLALMTTYVQPRPLNLWQSLMYLGDQGILSFEEDRLKVIGSKSLLSQLEEIPSNLDDLLSLRWSRIQENELQNGIDKEELNATARAVYFLGTEVIERISALGGTSRAVDRLLRSGILSSRTAGRIQFFHSQIFAFFRHRYASLEMDRAIRIKEIFESLRLTRSKFQQYFIVSHFARHVSRATLVATVRNMDRSGLTTDYWRQYTETLLSYLRRPDGTLSATALTGAAVIGKWQEKFESLQLGAETLCNFLAQQVLKASRNRVSGASLFRFYTATTNACLAIYDDPRALEVIEIALGDLEHAKFSNNGEQSNALATILNRKAATLKNFGRAEEALDAGREALQRFKDVGNRSMEVETLFDLSSILLPIPGQRIDGWRLMEEGCQIFDLYIREMVEPAPCRYLFIKAQLALRDQRFADVFRFCTEGIRHAEQVRDHFWGIRILLLEVVARLLSQSNSNADLVIINRLLIRARDWANISHAERSRWGLAYLDGKLLIRMGEYARAAKAFSEAIINLADRLRFPEQLSWKQSLFRDIAATCKRYHIEIEESAIAAIASSAVREEFREILKMSAERFEEFEEGRVAQSIFHNGHETVQLP